MIFLFNFSFNGKTVPPSAPWKIDKNSDLIHC